MILRLVAAGLAVLGLAVSGAAHARPTDDGRCRVAIRIAAR